MIGRITKAQGRRGEVVVTPIVNSAERFCQHHSVFLLGEDGVPTPFPVQLFREHKGRPVLKFVGIDSIGEAEKLVGRELRVPVGELECLPEDGIYHFELLGCEVWDECGGRLGEVHRVLETGGTDLLVVLEGENSREGLIPLCREICVDINMERRYIKVRLPEGLLELNAN